MYSDLLENSIGVPQGSNLGPLFFLIFFNDLPTFITENIDCYADGSTLGATAEQIVDIGNKLSSDCGQLSDWMQANTFKLNADKTHFLVMGTSARLNNMEEELVVMMDGDRLEESKDKSAELLGVTMQCNLKWLLQIDTICTKTEDNDPIICVRATCIRRGQDCLSAGGKDTDYWIVV